MNVQISVQEYRYGTRAYEVGRELQRYPLLTDLLPGGRGGGGGGGGGGNRCPPPLHALPSILPWLLLLSDHSAHPSSYLQGGLNSIKTCWRSPTGDAKAQSTLELFKQ